MPALYFDTFLGGNQKKFLVCILVACLHISTYAQLFVRINSGTKSNIRQIVMLKEDEGYFLGGSSKVFMNQSRNTQTLKLKLEGVLSNRDAIGAKIYLYSKDPVTRKETLESFQEISGGGGYASISAKDRSFHSLFFLVNSYFAQSS